LYYKLQDAVNVMVDLQLVVVDGEQRLSVDGVSLEHVRVLVEVQRRHPLGHVQRIPLTHRLRQPHTTTQNPWPRRDRTAILSV